MKSKRVIFILLLVCGLLFAFTIVMIDFSLIKKGENLIALTLPLSFLISGIVLLSSYIDKIKEQNKQ